MSAIADVREKLDRVLAQSEEYLSRENFNPDDEGYKALKSESANLERAYREMQEWETRRSESDKIGSALSKIEGRQKAEQKELQTRESSQSLGEMFIRSDIFKGYQGRGTSGRMTIDQPLLTRAVIESAIDPGKAFIGIDKTFVQRVPTFNTPLLSLANPVQVATGNVEYVVSGATPVAAVVPEKELKPEAILTAQTVSAVLDTIAHHVVVTRQALEDSSQLRSWIDGNLVRGVAAKLEELAATALTGATLPTASGADLLSAIRVGVSTVQMAGYAPNAVAINPADAAAIDLAILTGTLGGASIQGAVWGLSLAPTPSVPVGSPIVGDFTSGLTFFYRAGTDVLISDSHADFFLRNQFVILAERRALSAVTQPAALAECTVTVTP
jgi:HK97 family phage major capsid protein